MILSRLFAFKDSETKSDIPCIAYAENDIWAIFVHIVQRPLENPRVAMTIAKSKENAAERAKSLGEVKQTYPLMEYLSALEKQQFPVRYVDDINQPIQ